eukprot:4045563-Alexandrium_andersonii.AAC.1
MCIRDRLRTLGPRQAARLSHTLSGSLIRVGMATPPGNQRAPVRPFLPPTVDRASHQWAGDI